MRCTAVAAGLGSAASSASAWAEKVALSSERCLAQRQCRAEPQPPCPAIIGPAAPTNQRPAPLAENTAAYTCRMYTILYPCCTQDCCTQGCGTCSACSARVRTTGTDSWVRHITHILLQRSLKYWMLFLCVAALMVKMNEYCLSVSTYRTSWSLYLSVYKWIWSEVYLLCSICLLHSILQEYVCLVIYMTTFIELNLEWKLMKVGLQLKCINISIWMFKWEEYS